MSANESESTVRVKVPVEVPNQIADEIIEEFAAARKDDPDAQFEDFLFDRLELDIQWSLPDEQKGC